MTQVKKNAQTFSRRHALKATAAALLTTMAGAPMLVCAQTANGATPQRKALVVYFSKTGNTRAIAQEIHRAVGGDIFEVRTVQAYPEAYRATVDIARKEQDENARPALATDMDSIAQYDTIFIGYPNWWGTLPMALFTFLEGKDFNGKTVVPFCTHEGSGLGRGPNDIKRVCVGATVLDGLAIRGSRASRAQEDVTDWLKALKLI